MPLAARRGAHTQQPLKCSDPTQTSGFSKRPFARREPITTAQFSEVRCTWWEALVRRRSTPSWQAVRSCLQSSGETVDELRMGGQGRSACEEFDVVHGAEAGVGARQVVDPGGVVAEQSAADRIDCHRVEAGEDQADVLLLAGEVAALQGDGGIDPGPGGALVGETLPG